VGCVYQAKSLVNGKLYIGKTMRTLEERKVAHLSASREGLNYPFPRAIHRHGLNGFEWRVLFESNNDAELLHMEKVLIAVKGSKVPAGYNSTDGGEGSTGLHPTEETRAKISASQVGVGKSLKTRARMSAAKLGVKKSLETRAKMSAAKLGVKASPEHRASVSAAMRKVWRQRKYSALYHKLAKAAE